MNKANFSFLASLGHHAYCLVGFSVPELKAALEKLANIRELGNPDYYSMSYNNFTIDDARALKSLHDTRPIGETEKKIFILDIKSITVEAENALLKLFEEPASYAHFFILVPSAHLLLPTVRSRLLIVENSATEERDLGQAKTFLASKPAQRLNVVKDLLDDISKEKKTKHEAILFLNDLEEVIYKELGIKKGKKSLEAISFVREYMNDRSPSMKMLLEYVALAVDGE